MDMPCVNRRVASEIADPLWAAGTGSSAAPTRDSFADHLQPEPPLDPAAHAAEPPAAPTTHTVPDDPPPSDQGDDDDRDDQEDEQESQTSHRSDDVQTQVEPVPTEAADTADLADAQPAAPRVPDAAAAPNAEKPAERRVTPGDLSARVKGTVGRDTDARDASQAATPDLAVQSPATKQPSAARSPADAPSSGAAPAPLTQGLASPSSAADPAVVLDPATSPGLGTDRATVAAATTAAAQKTSGKPKPERASTGTRPAGAPSTTGDLPSGPAAKSDRAAADLPADLVGRALEAATAESSTDSPDADRASTADIREGDARTPGNERTGVLPERFSEHLFARTAIGSHATGEVTQADQLRLIQRVARAMEAASQRDGLLRLRLRPPELGSLRLEVSVQDGNLSARIEAETQTAKALLLDQLPQLRDRLAEHGLRIEQFEVDVADQHGQQSADMPGQPHDADDAHTTGSARPRPAESTESLTQPDRPALSINFFVQPIRLDVVI